jgi:tetratricopeptide (TPR) repeat protein
MAVDRNTVIKEAQKFAGKGQFDKAIAEWRKLVKESPNDATLFNTIGDLCLKKNSKAEAVDAYKRAADLLAEDGFTSKAIALYKKVLNIDPDKVEVHLALGDMNADKGLTGNALESYKVVADHYKKKNDMPKALGIYQKMADLSPANVAFRMKLADMYLKEGMRKEGVKAYLDAADQHVSKEAFQEARQMFEKVLAVEPDNKAVYHKAGIVYFKEGKFVEACKALKPAFENDPENQELIDLYLEALTKAGRAEDAGEVYKKLLTLDPSRLDLREKLYQIHLSKKDYDKALKQAVALAEHKAETVDFTGAAEILKGFIAVAHDPVAGASALAELFSRLGRSSEGARELVQAADALIARGSTDDAREVLAKAGILAPDLYEVKERLSGLSAAPAEAKGPVPPPAQEFTVEEPATVLEELPVTAPQPVMEAPVEEEDHSIVEALTEVDVLIKYGLGAKAVEQLEGAIRAFPENPKLRARLLDLYREQKNTGKAVVQALMLAELYEKLGREQESRSVLQAALELAPGNVQIMAKLGVGAVVEEPEVIETIEEPESIEMIPEVPDLAVPDLDLETPAEEIVDELHIPGAGLDEEGPSHEAPPAVEPPAAARSRRAPVEPEEAEEVSFGDEMLFEEAEEEAPAPVQAHIAETDTAELWSEAEFYFQQGLFDEARKHYERILELKPGDRRAMDRVVEITREKEEYQEFSRLADAVEGLESIVDAGSGATEDIVTATDVDSVKSLMQEITEMRKGKKAAPAAKKPAKAPKPADETAEFEESFADIAREIKGAAAPKAKKAPERADESSEFEESFADIAREIKGAAAPKAKEAPERVDESSEFEESFADIAREIKGAKAPKAPSLPPAEQEDSGASGDFFDLAAELRDELSTAPAQKTPAASHDQSLDEIFEEFKKGVEDHEKKEDEDTHYNLGVAYREMGLLDDAVSEFNMTNEGEPKFIQSRYMLGLCYLEKGDYETAILEIQNALGYSYSFGEASEERVGMHYDLGLAFQGVGNNPSSLEEFQKVFAIDPSYRDVATKVQELQQGDFISLEAIKEDIEKEISFKFLEEGARIEREEKTKKVKK